MDFYSFGAEYALKRFNSDKNLGLSQKQYRKNLSTYGYNVLTKKKNKSFFARLFCALKEPMIIILIFGLIMAFGTNLGKQLKSGKGDFVECFGILFAIILSVFITLIMEGSSQKAFNALSKVYDNVAVRVIREGKVIAVSQKDVAVGDVVVIDSGDKIIADGRLVESKDLFVDESALTGESSPVRKNAEISLNKSVSLADRVNCVYSGTFVTTGSAKMVVTAVGDKTEIGNIASELLKEKETASPLQSKLSSLGKTITLIGIISAVMVFTISVVRLAVTGNLNFSGVQDLFISCIVLIVAAVPEGLPTIVAISLALNMIKLAKGNALIKKMSATETAGAVSVICSDKTGTLTQNKMSVVSVCLSTECSAPKSIKSKVLLENFVLNSTAEIIGSGKSKILKGSATECALLTAYEMSGNDVNYERLRQMCTIIDRQPFTSEEKIMTTTVDIDGTIIKYLKGAPEKVVDMCALSTAQKIKLLKDVKNHQKKARRVLCFAHATTNDLSKYIYDGFVSIQDPVRKDVKKAVKDCFGAGIKVKMLTGDNLETAFAVANELNIASSINQVINAVELEKLNDAEFEKAISKITVIARSTPAIKLRVVRALKNMGEVVAVTGDGINDAPAIKHADVGIAMGIAGSEITKEAADIVLLDDSFSTVVKAVAFGRNVYKNLQRFILFQLSVNLSALLFITVCAVVNLPTPFNTMQLLWVNLIMDGPPALTLGLENSGKQTLLNKPVKRTEAIIGKKTFLRILFNGVYVGVIMLLQYNYNFLGVCLNETHNAIFSLFILFQLFNAFNSRELGAESIFKSVGANKVMVFTFVCVFILHLVIVQFIPSLFGVSPMSFISWIKVIFTSFSIILVSEAYKAIYRAVKYRLSFKREIKKYA